jgi:hypothetical protein
MHKVLELGTLDTLLSTSCIIDDFKSNGFLASWLIVAAKATIILHDISKFHSA